MDPIANPVVQAQDLAYPNNTRTIITQDELRVDLQLTNSRASGQSKGANEEKQEPQPEPKERPQSQRTQSITVRDEELLSPTTDDEDAFPEGGLRAWLVVGAAWLLIFPSFGLIVSIGTLQDYWGQHQLSHLTSRDIGWIPSVLVYLTLGLGIWVGPLFDRYGPRWIALTGSTGFLLMIFLLAECTQFWQMVLCCGVLGGLSGAMLTTTSLAAVAHWFKERRGLAQGIAMMGSTCGGFTIPLLLKTTLPQYGYQWSLRIIGFMFLACFILGNLLIRARIPPTAAAKSRAIISWSIYLDLRLSLFTLAVFGFEVVLFGALGILPTYATLSNNFPAATGFNLISVLNGVSCVGRILPGYVADKIGRFNTLLIMIVFTLVWMLALWLPLGTSSISALYCFAGLFGFGTGSWMALTPACVGQLCRADEFGRYYGSMYFIASLATLVCIPISGELVQMVGPQPMVAFFCAVLGLSLVSFVFSRWACLGRRWILKAKI